MLKIRRIFSPDGYEAGEGSRVFGVPEFEASLEEVYLRLGHISMEVSGVGSAGEEVDDHGGGLEALMVSLLNPVFYGSPIVRIRPASASSPVLFESVGLLRKILG